LGSVGDHIGAAHRGKSRHPTVAIRACGFAEAALRRPRFLSRYARSESHLSDFPSILHMALRKRFAPTDDARADLEYVPWPCILQPRTLRPPRWGTFTLFPSAWASFALECFEDTRYMCADRLIGCSSNKLRGMLLLTIESPSYAPSWSQSFGQHAQLAEVILEKSTLASFPGGKTFQVPYPTSSRWDGDRMPDAPELSKRTALAALVANVHENNSHGHLGMIGRSPLRALLHAECRAAPTGECIARGTMRGSSGIWQTNNETEAAYRRAVFCLQPWGDSATRKGFWDAVLAGCINAVFGEAGWNETDAWFGDHRDFTVRVPIQELQPGGRGVLGFLRTIPADRVHKLFANVLAVRGRAHFAVHPGTPGGDAVDVVVLQLQAHLARLRASGNLPRDYGGGNACQSTIEHICRQDSCRPARTDLNTTGEWRTPAVIQHRTTTQMQQRTNRLR